jgi:uncharacterized membrane protein (DUF2068 family)
MIWWILGIVGWVAVITSMYFGVRHIERDCWGLKWTLRRKACCILLAVFMGVLFLPFLIADLVSGDYKSRSPGASGDGCP